MKKSIYIAIIGSIAFLHSYAQPTIRLTDTTLMHEMRTTPSPLDKAVVKDRAVSFLWPLRADVNVAEELLDGVKSATPKTDKSKLCYQVRYSQDAALKNNVTLVDTRWPFFNPEKALVAGKWYWQYGYVEKGKTIWSKVLQFTVEDNPQKFCPPALKTVLSGLPKSHPRVWVMKDEWKDFMKRSKSATEYQWYIEVADKAVNSPMPSVDKIDTRGAEKLDNEVKRQALITRESRRVIDKEETNTEALIRAYLLTQDKRYYEAAIARVLEMISWSDHQNVAGDFNAATMLSLCSMAYDSFYDLLSDDLKAQLLKEIKHRGGEFYANFNNRLENHIADNHVWQMTLRIFTMAAFSVYGEMPEADTWVDYCYNVWLARFPGLNKDGGWHNGDSYFTVNTRTLIEVPYYYSKLSGFDFFSDPWYQGSIMYTIFQQPPFSKSGGNGSSHQNVVRPNSIRVSYTDALARLTGNTYAADYTRRTLEKEPNYLKKALLAKPGDLAWFRLQCNKPLPQGAGLADLPMGYVFPATGLASFMTNWNSVGRNAMLSFRSSPYGSTSHALANQNAFNTFYGGSSLFYSSGHHISFTDEYSVYCHRATRAHNTILVNGMGQRIGTEGYGWIPRYYVGEKIGYVVGDASNAYGKVISPLWLERGKHSKLDYSPVNGWDENHLKTFRRHIVELGTSGLTFIYDELEADEPVTWSYLLHTVINPMTVKENQDYVHIQATNKNGASDAYLFSSGKLATETTDKFFIPAVNWLRADSKGNFAPYANHWHFTATSSKQKVYRFATVINTHALARPAAEPVILKDGRIKVGSWIIKVNTSAEGMPMFFIRSTKVGEDVNITYKGGATIVREDGYETTLTDKLPELEI
ncbi:DUF4962 domain-containing protein [Bacteroides difficilis]|uniref:DUF4962 domain-containing protein n=1 Tax=Bacteroides difficilis TaxID=2763021 RepID=A0ABR7C890_9BACE|nr:DUF4962 domain-containing protein [Bacteroides difficilis]MBC5604020.1 DUF4962 domain-containing protein [Bacteroides difficilis]